MNPAPPILALASDYDATLAFDGNIAPPTRQALARFKASSRKLLLITGRELEDLLAIVPDADAFDCIVAENGAALYWPASRHNLGCNMSFADGHVEHWKWKGPWVFKFTGYGASTPQQDVDLVRVQATVGRK